MEMVNHLTVVVLGEWLLVVVVVVIAISAVVVLGSSLLIGSNYNVEVFSESDHKGGGFQCCRYFLVEKIIF